MHLHTHSFENTDEDSLESLFDGEVREAEPAAAATLFRADAAEKAVQHFREAAASASASVSSLSLTDDASSVAASAAEHEAETQQRRKQRRQRRKRKEQKQGETTADKDVWDSSDVDDELEQMLEALDNFDDSASASSSDDLELLMRDAGVDDGDAASTRLFDYLTGLRNREAMERAASGLEVNVTRSRDVNRNDDGVMSVSARASPGQKRPSVSRRRSGANAAGAGSRRPSTAAFLSTSKRQDLSAKPFSQFDDFGDAVTSQSQSQKRPFKKIRQSADALLAAFPTSTSSSALMSMPISMPISLPILSPLSTSGVAPSSPFAGLADVAATSNIPVSMPLSAALPQSIAKSLALPSNRSSSGRGGAKVVASKKRRLSRLGEYAAAYSKKLDLQLTVVEGVNDEE
jgi:hypothetical protein